MDKLEELGWKKEEVEDGFIRYSKQGGLATIIDYIDIIDNGIQIDLYEQIRNTTIYLSLSIEEILALAEILKGEQNK